MVNACPIWGTPAVFEHPGGDYVVVKSARAGGNYRASSSVNFRDLTGDDKTKLTSWLMEQRRLGQPAPMITTYTLGVVRSRPNLTVLERRDRALEFLAQQSPTLGTRLRVAGLVDDEHTANLTGLLIASGSQEESEARAMLSFLENARFIEKVNQYYIHITFDGWNYLEKQRSDKVASVQAFVAMWFDPSVNDAYDKGIAPAISASGYTPVRIDKKEHINKIDDEIVAEIRRSRFVVADFTSNRDQPRGGVYFEAGLAMGLNKPVIWTCRQDLIDQVHFDTRQFNHITWSNYEELQRKLKTRIGAVLGDGPLMKS